MIAPHILTALDRQRNPEKKTGPRPTLAGILAQQLKLPRKRIRHFGLDRLQTDLAWQCRWNDMVRVLGGKVEHMPLTRASRNARGRLQSFWDLYT